MSFPGRKGLKIVNLKFSIYNLQCHSLLPLFSLFAVLVLSFSVALPALSEEAVIKRRDRKADEEVLTNIPMLGKAPKGKKPVSSPAPETVSFYSPRTARGDSLVAAFLTPDEDKGYSIQGNLLTNLPYVPWRTLGPTAYDSLIEGACVRYGMDPELIRQVIRAESGFNPRAMSPKGAIGLMQLMPQTARDLGILDPWDPAQNIDGGVRYLRQMLETFQGTTELALAAYNAGPKRVLWCGTVPPIPETRAYVSKIMGRYGKSPASLPPQAQPADTGSLPIPVDLSTLAPEPPRQLTPVYLVSDGKGNIVLTNVPVVVGKDTPVIR